MYLVLLLIIFFLLSIFLVFFVVQFFNIVFRGYAPLISTKSLVIKRILSEIELKNGERIYELGCGEAGFLYAIEDRYPQVELIGVEYSFLPYLISKIQISFKKSKIKIIKQNLFNVNLNEANLIYCYLNQAMMNKLEDKFKKECRLGTKIISYAFRLPNFTPEKVIDLGRSGKVYFYKI